MLQGIFGIMPGLLWLVIVIDVIGTEPIRGHMWLPSVVPDFKFVAQFRQMINAFDDGDLFEPFIFQDFVGSFGDREGAVFSYGSQPWLEIIFTQSPCKDLTGKNMGLIRDDMFRWAILFNGTF